MPLAGPFRVQLLDFDTGAPSSDAVVVQGTRTRFAGKASGVSVEAIPGEKVLAVVGAGAQGGSGSTWQIFAPWDFERGELMASFAQLAPGERLGVLLVNSGGRDDASVEVRVDGAAPADAVQQALRADAPVAAQVSAGHELLREREAALALEGAAPAEAVESAPHRSFCVVPKLDFSRHLRKPATLLSSTPHADIYADDDDLGEYEGPALEPLAQAIEARVAPAIFGSFGAPTDVDGNGKLIVLLSHELGDHLNGGWLIGYFGNADLVRARDDSAGCTSTGSNHGEIVYLNDPRNGDRFVELRKGFFPDGNFPASALITVSHFARPGMLIEIQGVAVVGG